MKKPIEKELFDALSRARTNNAGKLTETQWLEVARPFFEAKRKPRRSMPLNKMTDDEFITWLENEPTLIGVDVRREIGRCQLYFRGKGKTPSRQRIVNWMLKADKTLAHSFDGASSLVKRDAGPDEPDNWRIRMAKEYPTNMYSGDDRPWRLLPESWKKTIIEVLSRPT